MLTGGGQSTGVISLTTCGRQSCHVSDSRMDRLGGTMQGRLGHKKVWPRGVSRPLAKRGKEVVGMDRVTDDKAGRD